MQVFNYQDKVERVLNDVEVIANNLFLKGWSEKNAGNISIKLPGNALKNQTSLDINLDIPLPDLAESSFYVTSKGSRMQDIAKSAISNGVFIIFNETGTAYQIIDLSNKKLQPTSELSTHLATHSLIAKRGTNETAVLHTHATELITLTHNPEINSTEKLNQIIWGMHPEAIMFIPKGVGMVEFLLPGSPEVAKATLMAFEYHDIVLWDRHGVFAIGDSITEAYDSIDIVCKSAKIYLACLSAGFSPKGLLAEQLNSLKQSGKKYNH